LLGCSKENFFKLLELMQYRKIKNLTNKEEMFIYKPKKMKLKNKKVIINNKESSPFSKLSELRFR